MEDFESLYECDREIKVTEESSDNEDCSWNSKQLLTSSLTKATKKDGPNPTGKGARASKSGAQQPRRSSSKSRASLENNLSKSTEMREKSLRCKVCEKSFRERSGLDSHMLSHLHIKSYECNACEKIFDSKRLLREHSCSVFGQPYQFTVFRQGYSKKGNLLTIMDTKSAVKHCCAVCEKVCSDKTALKHHMRTHTGENPYECCVCDKRFTLKYLLKYHLRTHTGEKPYHCALCEKSFGKSNHLKRHMLVHTREKPHHCTVCGNNFSRKSNLVTHMRIHKSDNPKRSSSARNTLHDFL